MDHEAFYRRSINDPLAFRDGQSGLVDWHSPHRFALNTLAAKNAERVA